MSERIPPMGLGTYGRTGEAGAEAILAALEIGYRHLDTAQSYDTERPVGRALRRSGLKRDEVFLTTKVDTGNLSRDRFLPSVRASLEALQTDRIDLLLIHWPSPRDAVPFGDYVTALAEARELGLARLIGVSNFPVALVERARALIGANAIATNQVEVHPFLQNRRLRDHCAAAGIAVTAYMPLAKGKVANDPVLQGIARRHGAEPGQVALAFLLRLGLIVIPASSRPERMRSNFAATALALDEAEMAAIAGLDRGGRMIDPVWGPAWD